ncbi:MAG: anion transporter [Oceanicaulis sp.]|uniref:SLC13 family permease n=1 Tax=Oceanicaulis sp. UBA2681 TaxID=1947007 RepID=UPI000C0A8AD4|nr:DASS family sodium-coupled anion symporter [Oceanicaulis sp. UBA2681]MAP48763.1 anion transporter [Oceanicaulis sp.]|tara:strand:+ start:837 stop:2303 length:1467 start_codon:yes stop_codon:yes gene_type:complete
MIAQETSGPALYQRVGLVLGPIAALITALTFSPEGLPQQATIVAAIGVLMAIWWATEAIPVAITAFLPLVALPILGVVSTREIAAPYAHPIIYLFFGGFVVALAIERCGLHRRIALGVFAIAGADARALVAGFMGAAAFVSMWISNTSTTLMLLPIAVSVFTVINETMPTLAPRQRENFGVSLLLGLAYGATLGGVATLVGTPPNAFMVGFMADNYDVQIDFARWMMVGVPVTLVMLPLAWLVLTRFIYPINFKASDEAVQHIRAMREGLGAMSKAEVRTALLFGFLVFGWLSRSWLSSLPFLGELTDTGVAMTAAVAAFLIPSGQKGQALMTWDAMSRLPWGVLALFGGGLALATAVTSSGLALWMGQQLVGVGTINAILLVVTATALVIFITELTSNLATTATFLPVIAAIGVETGQDPLIYVIPVTLAASCAFMLPVATPPNAVVFSSGLVAIPAMARVGLVLNIIAVAVLSVVALLLAPVVFPT